MKVAVYCGSSNRVHRRYFDAARELGEGMARDGHTLLFGGGDIGLMGEIARGVHRAGGRVVGVIPRALRAIEGQAYGIADEMIVTETMQERKNILFTRADAFVALPGGLGTLEEFAEVATLRKLGYLDKPIFLLNTRGFFDTLLSFLSETEDLGFSTALASLYTVAETPGEILSHLNVRVP